MSSIRFYDVSVALIGSSILLAYSLWFASLVYKSFSNLKSNGLFRFELLSLIVRVNFFVTFILTANEFLQNTNIFSRECNKFSRLFADDDTGFLDFFYLSNSSYWIVFFKYLILKLTDSTLLLAASADIVTLQFSLLKKFFISIDKLTLSIEYDYSQGALALFYFLVCIYGNQRIGMIILFSDLVEFIRDTLVSKLLKIEFIRDTLASKLLKISVSIQLKRQYGKQIQVVIIVLLFILFIIGIQFIFLMKINETCFFWGMTIFNLKNAFEMITSLVVYAFLVIQNLKDDEHLTERIDEIIYYILAFAIVITFMSSIVLLLLGIYYQIFESMSIIGAVFILTQTQLMFSNAKNCWSTLNLKISNMTLFNTHTRTIGDRYVTRV